MPFERWDFEGVVVRRDDDGFGVVKFTKSPPEVDREKEYGIFTEQSLPDRHVDRQCVKGQKVEGRVERYGDAYRVLQMSTK